MYLQAYILSLTSGDESRCESVTRCTEDEFTNLQHDHDQLERESQSVFTFCEERHLVAYWGLETCVAQARDLVNARLALMGTQHHDLLVAVKSSSSEEDDKSFLHTHSLSPSADSCHDSCYDSDGSPSASRRSSYACQHDDVSRTVSDTLAAELLADDKPLQPSNQHIILNSQDEDDLDSSSSEVRSTIDNQEQDLQSFMLSTEWLNKLEKTLKLGYSEDQLKAALLKLGLHCTQNELLNELVQLGKLNQPTEEAPVTMIEETLPMLTMYRRESDAGVVDVAKGPDDEANLRPIVIDGSNVAMR